MHLRIAQIKAYPQKGDLHANHERLVSILRQVQEHRPDVVVTPECFLDGYIVTEDWLSGENLANYPSSYSYASTSRIVNRDALRAGTMLATTDSSSTTPSHTANPCIVKANLAGELKMA